jgi:hypothetical protein
MESAAPKVTVVVPTYNEQDGAQTRSAQSTFPQSEATTTRSKSR